MNVLVVVAHPDDEVLGCGGTIAQHAQCGDSVHVLILAEGVTSRYRERDRHQKTSELSALAQAAYQAKEILGIDSLKLMDFPDNRMDSCDLLDVIKAIEPVIQKHAPERIYTHHPGDVNIDHQKISEAVITAARPLPKFQTKTILFFEVPSSTEWQVSPVHTSFFPNWFVDISKTLNVKQKALKAYESEMRSYPHPRSYTAIEHLARWRGATAGLEAAEAFVLARHQE
jgi:LmbE family N-acetylglucosaminyl deacetylase